MFRRMLKGALTRQKSKLLMIALTMALGVSLATAMLNVMMDVGDKVNQELKAYGANLKLMPKNSSIFEDLYGGEGAKASGGNYLAQSDIMKIKTIFWAHNIVDFAPFLETAVKTSDGGGAKLVGTWFDMTLDLPTGEEAQAGVVGLKSWWDIKGEWLSDSDDNMLMVGERLAKKLGLAVGDSVSLEGDASDAVFTVKAIISSGGVEDDEFFATLAVAQSLSGLEGKVQYVDISALTTPENELARRAAQDPRTLTQKEWDTWYCTAYISAISYQLEEVLPNARAKAVLQVAESEGAILQKIQLLMLLLTILSLLCSALGISNLVTANVMERSAELGLMKAIGATDVQISLLMLSEIMITAFIGSIIGYFLGLGFAQIIGHTVFSSGISAKGIVIPILTILVILITLAGSVPALRMLLSLRPTEVLHGR